MSNSKQFWIYKGTSNFCNELVLDEPCENYIKQKPEGFYDLVSLQDTIEGGIHVIEYSAYEQLKAKLNMAKEALSILAEDRWIADFKRALISSKAFAKEALEDLEGEE